MGFRYLCNESVDSLLSRRQYGNVIPKVIHVSEQKFNAVDYTRVYNCASEGIRTREMDREGEKERKGKRKRERERETMLERSIDTCYGNKSNWV